jgi:hypothetical protein
MTPVEAPEPVTGRIRELVTTYVVPRPTESPAGVPAQTARTARTARTAQIKEGA